VAYTPLEQVYIFPTFPFVSQFPVEKEWMRTKALKKVSVSIYEYKTCTHLLALRGLKPILGPGHSCAGNLEGGQDICQADSGGPLIVPNGGRWNAIGIVAAGWGCGRKNSLGIYTNISAYTDWISQYLV